MGCATPLWPLRQYLLHKYCIATEKLRMATSGRKSCRGSHELRIPKPPVHGRTTSWSSVWPSCCTEPRVFLFLAIRRCLLELDRRLKLVLCWFLSHAPTRQKWKERRKRSRSTFLHTSGSSSVPKILFFRSLGFLKLRCAVIPDLTQPPIGFEHLASCSCHVVVDRGMIFFDFGMDRLV